MYAYTPQAQGSERPLSFGACLVLVVTAIAFGVCRFWGFEPPAGPMLTPAFAALSYLLSTVAVRIEQAARVGAWLTLVVVSAMGFVCAVFESAMTHMGLEWLNDRETFAPAWALWPAAGGLSLFNIFSVYAFAREIPASKEKAKRPRRLRAPRSGGAVTPFRRKA